MKIEIGKKYVDGFSKIHEIAGKTKVQPFENDVVYWSYGGHWFTENGQKVNYNEKVGYYLYSKSYLKDLVKEVID